MPSSHQQSGIHLIVLLALSDWGHPVYATKHGEQSQGYDAQC